MATRRTVLGVAAGGALGACGAAAGVGAAVAAGAAAGNSVAGGVGTAPGIGAAGSAAMAPEFARFYAPLQGADVLDYQSLLDPGWHCDAGSLRFGTDRDGIGAAVRLFRSLFAAPKVQLRRSSRDGDWLWVEGRVTGPLASAFTTGAACEARLEFIDLHRLAAGRIVATRHYERPCPRLLDGSRGLATGDAAWALPPLA